MKTVVPNSWSRGDYCLPAPTANSGLPALAERVHSRICRTDFDMPGFCLVDLGPTATSRQLRELMVALKNELQQLHRATCERDLIWISAGRFDQQTSTRFHRDGGPDECLLLLGYEPSPVAAEISLADYSRCAQELGITPAQYLEQHNPMFAEGEYLLNPFTTRVACFSNTRFQVLAINNSVAEVKEGRRTWQGVLHTAKILNPSDAHSRVVNSTMVASVERGTLAAVSERDIDDFVSTTVVRRRA